MTTSFFLNGSGKSTVADTLKPIQTVGFQKIILFIFSIAYYFYSKLCFDI